MMCCHAAAGIVKGGPRHRPLHKNATKRECPLKFLTETYLLHDLRCVPRAAFYSNTGNGIFSASSNVAGPFMISSMRASMSAASFGAMRL